MVQCTRLDCALAAAALMRQALAQAVHHSLHRRAFGRLLIDQPLMRNVLADLAIESQAATLMAIRLARSFDARQSDERERGFARLATAISKYWLCKRAPVHVGEALECLGGNGYVEESIMPRLYREAPLYSIWEGSGNVICLDILRAIAKEPAAVDAVVYELRQAAGADRRLDAFVASVKSDLDSLLQRRSANGIAESEGEARRLAERLALGIEASLIVRHGSSAEADAFVSSRIGNCGHSFGTLSPAIDVQPILSAASEGLAAP